MAHVDLCSGIGGFALGFERAGLSKPVQFCDIEPWSRRVLSKHWPDVPIAEDVKELARDPDRNVFDCDILSAGYPCQPFSVAGNQKGAEDDRHIWPYIREIVAHKRPAWCVFENVYGHIGLGLDQVLFDLESEGYTSRTFVVPACGVDAPHRRDRLWIVANTDSNDGRHISSTKPSERETRLEYRGGGDGQPVRETEQIVADTVSPRSQARQSDRLGNQHGSQGDQGQSESSSSEIHVADADSARLQGRQNARDTSQGWAQRKEQSPRRNKRTDGQNWPVEPSVGRVAHGIPKRVDRLRGLGNAIVPQIAQRIGETIRKIEEREA